MELIDAPYISLLFLALAAACNAVMDICSHHFYRSVFRKLSVAWWCADLSWANKYIDGMPILGRTYWIFFGIKIIKPVQITDAWHLFKMFMIIFLALSIITFNDYMDIRENFLIFLFQLCLYGIVWNGTFSLFYKYILKKDEQKI